MMRMTCGTVLFMALIATGCHKNEVPTPAADREIAFSASVAAMTRGPQLNEDGSGTFSLGDTFTLYACGDTEEFSVIDYTIGSSRLYWRDLPFATEGTYVDFAACYPPQTLDGDSFDFTVRQGHDEDLLLANVRDVAVGDRNPVSLTFRHAMHRLVVRFTLLDASIDPQFIETRCTALAAGRIHLPAGTLALGETTDTYSAAGPEVEFMLLPQPTGEVTLEIHTSGTTTRWTLASLDSRFQTLEAGKELTVNFTIRNGEVSFSGMTVEGWGDQGAIDGEIVM